MAAPQDSNVLGDPTSCGDFLVTEETQPYAYAGGLFYHRRDSYRVC